MNTSNYRKNGKNPNAVAISGRPPEFYTGKVIEEI